MKADPTATDCNLPEYQEFGVPVEELGYGRWKVFQALETRRRGEPGNLSRQRDHRAWVGRAEHRPLRLRRYQGNCPIDSIDAAPAIAEHRDVRDGCAKMGRPRLAALPGRPQSGEQFIGGGGV